MTLYDIYVAAKENADSFDLEFNNVRDPDVCFLYVVSDYVREYADSVFNVQLSNKHCDRLAKAFLDAEYIFNNETEWTLQLFNRIEKPLRSIEIGGE